MVRRFREGGFNTLVSTCVGEEGLDIGEVDLIVCFDAQKSPIRLVQRMGRTGRHRQGRIVVILAKGREERVSPSKQTNQSLVIITPCILFCGNAIMIHHIAPDKKKSVFLQIFISQPNISLGFVMLIFNRLYQPSQWSFIIRASEKLYSY